MSARCFSFVIALLAWVPAAAFSQVPEPAAKPSTTSSQSPAASGFVIEQQHVRVTFTTNGDARRELTWAVKVLDEQGVRAWGQVGLPYNSELETLALDRVEVRKPDGTIVPTPGGAIQDVAVKPFPLAPIFMDVHQKIAPVSALRPGDVLQVHALWTSTQPLFPGQFSFMYSFMTTAVVQDDELVLDVPADRAVLLRIREGAPAEAAGGSGSVEGSRRIYRWRTSNPVVKDTSDDPVDPLDTPPPDVRLTSFTTWDEVARWYRGLLPKAADPAVAAKASELTAGLTDEAAKIEAIYHFVSTQVRYVGLSFGLGRYRPHKPAEVLANQYGDCKDKQMLLTALLSAARIRSVPVLVNTTRSVDDDFPSPLEFDHLIGVVPRGAEADWLWVDTTAEVTPAGMLLPHIRDRRALLVGDEELPARVLNTPADPPFTQLDQIEVVGKVDPIGLLRAHVTYTMRSDSGPIFRTLLRVAPREKWDELIGKIASEWGFTGDVSSVDASDPADTRSALRLSFDVRSSGFLDWAAASSEASVPGPSMETGGWTANARKSITRLHFGSPSRLVVHASVEFPDGYELEAPVGLDNTGPGIQYESTYQVEGPRLTIVREMRTTVRDVPSAKFNEFGAFASAVAADVKQKIMIRRAHPARPALPADATSSEIYDAALSAYHAKQYEIAADFWRAVTEKDPKMGDAWVSLGLTYGKLGRYDEAATAIRKQVELDPFNKRAYNDLGFALERARHFEEAAKAYERHAELNPLNAAAQRRVGEIDFILRRYTDAAAAFDKALALDKQDGWALAMLGASYLYMDDREKAAHAFDQALAAEDSPRVCAKIAWVLADTGVDLARAEELSAKAIHDVARKMRELSLATLTEDDLGVTQSLGWAWDALGWARFRGGHAAEAEKYVHAAWILAGEPVMAFHVADVYERVDRPGEAVNFYVTARRNSAQLSPEMIQRADQFIPAADRERLLENVPKAMSLYRLVKIDGSAPDGRAEFFTIIGHDGHPLEVVFGTGDGALAPLASALKAAKLPVEFPGTDVARLPVGVLVVCHANECFAGTKPPITLEMPPDQEDTGR